MNELNNKEIDSFFSDKKISGNVLIAQGDKVLFEKSYGMANYELNVPNTKESVFRIGSLTKQFTGVLILKLIEEGKITLFDTLSKFIPDYPNGEKITLKHLLHHTSGIIDYTNLDNFNMFSKTTLLPIEIIKLFKNQPLEFKSGEKSSYSNSNYILLGYIIEQITKTTYQEYLNNILLKPLNLLNTGIDNSNYLIPNHVSGYIIENELIKKSTYCDMSIPFSAGNLYSTTKNLWKWNQALYSDNVLSQNEKILFNKEIISFFTYFYGFGTVLEIIDNKIIKYFHGGKIDGFSSENNYYPKLQLHIIVLLNIYTDSHKILDEFESKFINPKIL